MAADLEIRPNAVYTLSEVCQILRISDATARRQLKTGRLKGAQVGRAYRILGSQLLSALSGPSEDLVPVVEVVKGTRGRRKTA
ncbi:MAG: Helix-turn-helix domain [Chloroflexota bacterium]|jgi:excisionase family DNA binding protein|nr:Helix-turn-helix domain [Chloroflexota bacterium]